MYEAVVSCTFFQQAKTENGYSGFYGYRKIKPWQKKIWKG